jgi:hypothetical protein
MTNKNDGGAIIVVIAATGANVAGATGLDMSIIAFFNGRMFEAGVPIFALGISFGLVIHALLRR